MSRPILDALDIKPGQKGWTCIVQVIERHPILYKKLECYPFQKRYRHYLLTDMKGTKVKAVMFDSDIEFFARHLQPFKRYKISNANVTNQEEKYQLPGYKFSWIITSRVPVEPILDTKLNILPCSFDVCKFSDLHRYAESDADIAIKGLIVHRFPITDINDTESAKDYVVVNEEEIPIVLRLWKDMLEPYDPDIAPLSSDPVTIIASNLEVRTFHGLSLATRKTTYLIENPPLAEHLDLKKWYGENKEKVAEWVKNKVYENNSKFFPHPKASDILDLPTAMNAFLNVRTCWLKAKIRLNVTRALLYEIVCGNCQMTVDAGVDWDVECSRCSVLSPMQARLKLPINLFHNDMSLRTILRSPDAEKVCPYTALDVKKLHDQGVQTIYEMSIEMDNTEVVCFMKHYARKESHSENATKYVILKMYTMEEINSRHEAVATAEDAAVSLSSESSSAMLGQVIPSLTPCAESAGVEAQFFTPTTKKVLDQIARPGNEEGSTSLPSPPTKRAIAFGTVSPEDLENISTSDIGAAVTATLQSPQKKNKGSDNHP